MYLVAEGIARGAHAGGFRRDGKTPYFKHVKQVADRLKGWDLKTIGILHDTLEDTKLKEDDLTDAGFPKHIIEGVKAMTKPEMEYFTYINKQILGNPVARLVKLADLACNIKGNKKITSTPSGPRMGSTASQMGSPSSTSTKNQAKAATNNSVSPAAKNAGVLPYT